MSRKRVIAIVILILGVILISVGVYFIVNNNSDNNENIDNNSDNNINTDHSDNTEKPEIIIDCDSAYETAVSLYGGEGKTIEVKEESNKFIIYVKNSNGIIINTFNMDKKTGLISEEPQEFTE